MSADEELGKTLNQVNVLARDNGDSPHFLAKGVRPRGRTELSCSRWVTNLQARRRCDETPRGSGHNDDRLRGG